MLHDFHYALRGLRCAPGFALAAILTLALGIGASTTIYSVADAVLLRPLPYRESERLVVVWDQLVKLGIARLPLYAQIYREYSAQTRIFETTAAFIPEDRNLTGEFGAERVSTMAITPSLLPMLGVTQALGRGFTNKEITAAILSHELFLRRYGGDRAILGRSIRLDDREYTVIGVMPDGFGFSLRPAGVDVWTPLEIRDGGIGTLRMIARLRPGVSLVAARAAMSAVAKHLDETLHPHQGPNGEDPGFRALVVPLREELLGDFRSAALILVCAVVAVLLIACMNVANLLLARTSSREKEIAVRRALGASSARLIRQWMTAAATLCVLGGICGSVAASWGVRILAALSPAALPAALEIGVDARALGFAFVTSTGVCLLFGLAPSLKPRISSSLIAVEVAIALTLLASAGLLLKSFLGLSRVSPGFNPDRILTMRVQLPPQHYSDPDRRIAFFSSVQERLRTLPGTISAGAISRLPATGPDINSRGGNPFSIEGQAWLGGLAIPQMAHTQTADADYFRTFQIPLLSGRSFNADDGETSLPVTVVNETLARGFFPHGALGHRILLGAPRPGARWLTIVGVAGDVKTAGLDEDTLPQFYTPMTQDAPSAMTLVIRTTGDPLKMAKPAAGVVHELDPEQPVFDVRTMEDRVARGIGRPRFEAVLVAFFAFTALFLAGIGIYGVVAHFTGQRTREIGIRVALGAARGDVVQYVVSAGLKPAAIGAAAGLAGALAVGRMLSSVLFHVGANDPPTLTLALVVLTATAIVACWLPARRAARVDPAVALRAD